MQPLNKIEYDELELKIKQINELSNKVENILNKMNNLIEENVNSGKGIWDGPDASEYKNEWNVMEENIPNIVSIYRKQAENIENVIKLTTIQ